MHIDGPEDADKEARETGISANDREDPTVHGEAATGCKFVCHVPRVAELVELLVQWRASAKSAVKASSDHGIRVRRLVQFVARGSPCVIHKVAREIRQTKEERGKDKEERTPLLGE